MSAMPLSDPPDAVPVLTRAQKSSAQPTGSGRGLLLAAACCAAWAGSARAQSVDYGDLEQLFGEPVTTSATGKPQRVSQVPANMEIITAEEIRRSGADNLPDILQFVAGLDVRRYGFAAADVSVRGYNETSNARLLVLVNGQQVYLDDLGRTQWYTIPVELEEIRQIEVVKGPNTALFGFNAASGVVNIITYDPMRDPINVATVRTGTQGYAALSAVATGRIADVGGIRISAGGFRAREFNPTTFVSSDLAYMRSPQRGSVALDARMRIAPGVEAFASASALDNRVWEATASPYYGTDFHRTNAVRAGISADTSVGLITLTGYRNELRYKYFGATEVSDLHDTVYVLQASDVVKLGANHTVRVGLDYRNNTATSSRVLAGQVGYDVFSASAMWDWQIVPSLSLTNTVRLDHLVLNQKGALSEESPYTRASYKGRIINEPSFNSGLVWKATKQDTLRVLAARGLRLPSINDLGVQDRFLSTEDSPGYLFLGNPGMHASAVSNLEIGWDRSVAALRSVVRAAVFAQRTDNIITNPYEAEPVPYGDNLLLARAGNVGHSSAVGGEIGIRGRAPSGLRWNASYSYISVSDHLSINRNGFFSPQDYQHANPTHVVVLGGGYTLGRLELDVQSRWQSRFRDYRAYPTALELQPVEVGSHVQINARLGYRITETLTAAMSAQQFNVSHQLRSSGPPVERRVFLSLSARL